MTVPAVVVCALLLVGVCFLSALLSALETALFCLKEHHVVSLAKQQPNLANTIRKIARQPEQSVNQVLALSVVSNLIVAGLALLLVRETQGSVPFNPLVSALVLFGIIILLCDLIPKAIALREPGGVFRLTIQPLMKISPWVENFTDGVISLTDKVAAAVIPSSLKPRGDVTDEELETLVELHHEEGSLLKSESEIIQDIMKLGDKTVKDCLIPRVDAVLISDDLEEAEAQALVRESDYWRIPVYRDTPDVVIGILDVKSYFQNPSAGYHHHIERPVFVPETMMVLDAFREYLSAPHSLAVVLDEYGGLEGVISHDDIVEEIIGHAVPHAGQEPEIQPLGKDRLLAAGSARLDEIGEILELDLEFEGLDTIGGLIFNQLGHVPDPGTVFEMPEQRLRTTVRKTSDKRIEEVLVQCLPRLSED